MAVYVGGKNVQETGGKYQSKGIPEKSSSRPHHTTRERVGSRETGFTFRDTPITGGKPPHTPAEQFENLRLRKDELQHIPYSGDDSGRNMYQMGIQNLLGRGDQYKKAYLQKYPIGGRINLGVPAAFNSIMSKVVPGVSSIANIFGNKLSGAGQGIKNVFSGASQDLGFHKNKFMQDLSQAPSGFWNNLQTMLGGNRSQNLPDIKTTQTTEDIISPAALSRTYSVVPPQFLDLYSQNKNLDPFSQGDQVSEFDVAELTQAQKDFMNRPEQDLDYQTKEQLWNKIMTPQGGYDKGFLGFGAQEPTTEEEFNAYLSSMTAAQGGLASSPTNFASGGTGEIQDDAYARLKAINDSMHEM